MSPETVARLILAGTVACLVAIAIGLAGAVIRANDPDAEREAD
jgi:hypothetical protein